MRTTVDLAPGIHRRVRELASERHTSVSAMIGELTARGLEEFGTSTRLGRNSVTGLPVLSIGHTITSEDVARGIDDE